MPSPPASTTWSTTLSDTSDRSGTPDLPDTPDVPDTPDLPEISDPGAPVPAPRLQRDRVTVALYSTFTTWGWFLYSFSPAIPLIAAEQGISRAQAGLHGTALAAGTAGSGFLTGYLNPRLGRRNVLRLGGGVLVAGLALLVSGRTLAMTLPATLVIGMGGSLMISAAQPALAVHHHEASSAALTEANGVGALVGLLAPLALGFAVGLGLGWRPAVGATAVLVLAMVVLVSRLPRVAALDPRRLARPADPSAGPATTPVTPPRRAGFSAAFWFFMAAVVMAVAIENATTYWASDMLRTQTSISAGLASAAVTALVAGMSVARFTLGPLSLRVSPESLLIGSFALAGVGWLVFWLSSAPALALLGLVVAGLGYGAQYPIGVVLVLRASAGRPDAAQARSSFASGGALAVAPFLLGATADALGTHTAFLLIPVLLLLGALAVAAGRGALLRAATTVTA